MPSKAFKFVSRLFKPCFKETLSILSCFSNASWAKAHWRIHRIGPQKIYISSDIDSKYFSHYVSRCGNDIIDRNIIFKKFLNFYKEEFFIKERYNPTNIKTLQLFYNIFDLFVGINSDIVIVSESTWGYIPRYYHKQKDYIWLHGNDVHESNIIMYSKSDKWLPGDYKGWLDKPLNTS